MSTVTRALGKHGMDTVVALIMYETGETDAAFVERIARIAAVTMPAIHTTVEEMQRQARRRSPPVRWWTSCVDWTLTRLGVRHDAT